MSALEFLESLRAQEAQEPEEGRPLGLIPQNPAKLVIGLHRAFWVERLLDWDGHNVDLRVGEEGLPDDSAPSGVCLVSYHHDVMWFELRGQRFLNSSALLNRTPDASNPYFSEVGS